jgi:hypothetical protein
MKDFPNDDGAAICDTFFNGMPPLSRPENNRFRTVHPVEMNPLISLVSSDRTLSLIALFFAMRASTLMYFSGCGFGSNFPLL